MPLIPAEHVVVAWLDADLTGVRVVTETPKNLATEVPLVQVVGIGGSDSVLTLDTATIDVDAFALTREAARDLAERARTSMRVTLPGRTVAGAFVARVETVSAPKWVPYDNTALRRFVATYRVDIRSIP